MTFPPPTLIRAVADGKRNVPHPRQKFRRRSGPGVTLYLIPIFLARSTYLFALIQFFFMASFSAIPNRVSIRSWAILFSWDFLRRTATAMRQPQKVIAAGRRSRQALELRLPGEQLADDRPQL